jgi:hypothetical protein
MIVVCACLLKRPWRQRHEHRDRDESAGINDKLFAYNEASGHISRASRPVPTQLVEATESCHVSIIHPGKPRNPNEPNLPGLIRCAEAFQ